MRGAQERSRQSIELAQARNRLASAATVWNSKIRESSSNNASHAKSFEHAIDSTFRDRELSVFMVERLMRLTRAGYRADVALPNALGRIETECENEKDFWRERVQKEDTEKLNTVRVLQNQIQQLQRDMEVLRLATKADFLRKQIRIKRKEEKIADPMAKDSKSMESMGNDRAGGLCLSPVAVTEDSLHECTSSSRKDEKQKPSVEWIQIDDDYFQASKDDTFSDWVLCL